jgi:hypothetical protein
MAYRDEWRTDPCLEHGTDLSGRYLWLKQMLRETHSDDPPRVRSLTLSIEEHMFPLDPFLSRT